MSSQDLSSNDLREKYLSFFEGKGHKRLPSSSLIPENNDQSVLFTTAGMHPLVPYLLGKKHPSGNKLCDIQKCFRTDDIEEVGDIQHLTFFEMLGYWSLGDYFKKESIHYTWDFYTKVLGFNKDDISVTVFEGDDTVDFDEESYLTWKDEIGIPEERIYKYTKKENWWGPVSETGPCGPCTEMFIDTGIEACSDDCGPSCNCDKFVEIGNNVFMEFNKTEDGKFEKLAQKNVDVGLGFERLAMILQKKNSVFEIDIFKPIINQIERLSGKKYQDSEKEFRIIADHMRAATFISAEDVYPSNVKQGYVLRKLIRRSVRAGWKIGVRSSLLPVVLEVIKVMGTQYPELREGPEVSYMHDDKLETRHFGQLLLSKISAEEAKFSRTIEEGLKKFDEFYNRHIELNKNKDIYRPVVGSKFAFDMFQTYGFPLELTIEEFKNRNIQFIESKLIDSFNEEMKKHQDLSRTASAGMFKGGLADNKIETTRLHTAAHLLLAALRHELGEETEQKGSNITEERLRFDFNYPEKLSDQQLKKIEDLVNLKIEDALPVTMQELSIEEAKNSGATGSFHDKYGDTVKIFNIGNLEEPFSREICGGPHVKNTSELGHFKIIKEESSSSGIRRIKAVLE